MIIQPAKNFSNGITSLQKGTASADRIFAIIDTESQIKNNPTPSCLKDLKAALSSGMSVLAYEKELVLKNISLRVEKGKTIALVGPPAAASPPWPIWYLVL